MQSPRRDGCESLARRCSIPRARNISRSEEHTSELQSRSDIVCRLLLEKKKIIQTPREIFRPRNQAVYDTQFDPRTSPLISCPSIIRDLWIGSALLESSGMH